MLKRRVLCPDLLRSTRKPRRALRKPAERRSLVNCNHLATSDTKLTVAEDLAARNEHRKHRIACLALQKTLLDTLRGLALRDVGDSHALDTPGTSLSLPEAEKGPWTAGKDYRRLRDCQTEWIGFKPRCCNSAVVAVPIGCNHRLCPLCNASRLEHYRGPAREMLDRMVNPSFLTLTIPNVPFLTRKTFSTIRGWWKEFRRANEAFLPGGVYSIEVTFNRKTREWHPHLHILFDAPYRLTLSPSSFRRLKHRLEYSWARITSSATRKAYRRGDAGFEAWLEHTRMASKGDAWNIVNRRVVDLRRVQPGDGAVYEVIKYISKSNRFLDVPEAVEGYLRAVRGVRVIQTFGSFYNFKLDREDDPKSFLQCECGEADFERIGVFDLSSVYQAENGCWYLKQRHQHRQRCRGGPS